MTPSSRTAPAVSVVMPVRNAAAYLADSIGSILKQTLTDFEFVILDDGSTDDSRAIIREWARRDGRIRLIEGATPLGPSGSADRVVREARAPICARMDADDISHPNRLQAEWDVLARHPDASLVGTLWVGIDPEGRRVRPRDRWRLFRSSVFAPFPHGSVMFRREWLLGLGGYRPACEFWEDFDFYLRMERRGPIMVVADALYEYRFHTGATTAQRGLEHLMAVDLMYRCADRATAGEDYTALLGNSDGPPARHPIDPRALRSFASPRLWAGEKPAMLTELRRMNGHAWSPASLHTYAIGIWGEASPRSLRWVLRGLIRARDAVAGGRIPRGAVVRWVPRPEGAEVAR
jgi:glycosyltransferase involved in cell wall biosynthesis